MKLIIGLGNPGKQYKNTWHNLGFLTLDNFCQEQNFPVFKKNTKLLAETSEGKIGKEKLILARPLTFMNNSGRALLALKKYYKIDPADIIVVHDDLDLPLGKIRLIKNSSAGGHNGVKSIIENLGSQNFLRLKVGIKTPLKEKIETADYVLEKFNKQQAKKVAATIKTATAALEVAIIADAQQAMNQFN